MKFKASPSIPVTSTLSFDSFPFVCFNFVCFKEILGISARDLPAAFFLSSSLLKTLTPFWVHNRDICYVPRGKEETGEKNEFEKCIFCVGYMHIPPLFWVRQMGILHKRRSLGFDEWNGEPRKVLSWKKKKFRIIYTCFSCVFSGNLSRAHSFHLRYIFPS